MSEYEVTCPYCGKVMSVSQTDLTKVLPCQSCGKELRFEVDDPASQQNPVSHDQPAQPYELTLPLGKYPLAGATSVPPPEPPVSRPQPPPLIPPPSEAPQQMAMPRPTPQRAMGSLPERMKANRLIAGKTCAGCGKTIELAQDVFNCMNCGQSLHAACREQLKGCANEQCISYYAAAVPPPIPASQRAERGACPPDSKPCRFCGEFIKKTARKCRFCDEFQEDADRSINKGKKSDDDTLTGGEIAFGLLCGGVAYVAGIIFGLMGKKKGWKMMLLGIVSSIVWNIIIALVKTGSR